jgi:ribosomal protein S6--L-glutamate ligase
MNFGVLANTTSWYWNELERVALARGHRCQRIEFNQLRASCGLDAAGVDQAQISLNQFDAIIVRTMPPGTLEQVVFRMDALASLQRSGVEIVNSPKAIECATDKYLTTARLEAAGLPVPRTVVCQETESAMTAFETLGGDVVIKPIFGAEGRGICRVSDPDLAFRTFRTLERTGAVIYAQEFIPHPGFDVRVLVLRGRVLGGMKRFGADGDFRTNCSRNGRGEAYQPNDVECDWALRAADSCGATFAGIDLLYDNTGRGYVIEVNAVPGWQAFNRANQVNIADTLIAELEMNSPR